MNQDKHMHSRVMLSEGSVHKTLLDGFTIVKYVKWFKRLTDNVLEQVSEQNHNKMIEQIFVKVTGQVPAMTEQI
jgi:hypothetical protein